MFVFVGWCDVGLMFGCGLAVWLWIAACWDAVAELCLGVFVTVALCWVFDCLKLVFWSGLVVVVLVIGLRLVGLVGVVALCYYSLM